MDHKLRQVEREARQGCPLAIARLSVYYDRAGIIAKAKDWMLWEEHFDDVFWHAKRRYRVMDHCPCCSILVPSLYKAHLWRGSTSKFARGKHKSLRSHRDGTGSKEWRRWNHKMG